MEQTREPQYKMLLDLRKNMGLTKLGLMTNQVWYDDPRRLLFYLARYKFVSKMFSGKKRVLEVGCGDAFGSRIILQEVESLLAVDFDPIFVKDVNQRMSEKWLFECREHDMLSGPIDGMFDAIYSLDVIEHIPKEFEQRFMSNICQSLSPVGTVIIGMPSLQSQLYATPQSKEGHVNCMDHKRFKELMMEYFQNVFIFSMNDEVVHTGFYSMAHYLFALCVGVKCY